MTLPLHLWLFSIHSSAAQMMRSCLCGHLFKNVHSGEHLKHLCMCMHMMLCMMLSLCMHVCFHMYNQSHNPKSLANWKVDGSRALASMPASYSSDRNCCQAPSRSAPLVSAGLDRCLNRTLPRPCFALTSGRICVRRCDMRKSAKTTNVSWVMLLRNTPFTHACAWKGWKPRQQRQREKGLHLSVQMCTEKKTCVCVRANVQGHFTVPVTRSHRKCVCSRPPCTPWHHHSASWNTINTQARTHTRFPTRYFFPSPSSGAK